MYGSRMGGGEDPDLKKYGLTVRDKIMRDECECEWECSDLL
jgi:hypothetical protein